MRTLSPSRVRKTLALVGCALLVSSVLLALAPAAGTVAETVRAAAALDEGAVGEPRHGDQASYDIFVPWAEGPHAVSLMWNGSSMKLDPWNHEVVSDVVEMIAPGRVLYENPEASELPRLVAFAYQGGGVEPLLTESVSRSGGWGGGLPLVFPEVTIHRNSTVTMYEARHGVLPCLARAAWQGLALDDVESHRAEDLCPRLPDGGGALRDAGSDEVGGVVARRFTSEGGDAGNVTVSLAPGIPYPLRLVVEREGGAWEAVLTGFAPGDGLPLLSTAVPLPPDPPALSDFAAFTRAGPVDGRQGVWTAEEAVAAIEGDLTLTRFREWRAGHPEARVTGTWFHASHATYLPACAEGLAARPSESWSVTWRGDDGTIFSAGARRPQSCEPASPLTNPAMQPARGALTSTVECSNCPFDTGHPGLSDPPARALTYDALARRFEAFRVTDELPISAFSYWEGTEGGRYATAWAHAPWATEATEESISFDAETGAVASRSATLNVTVTQTPAPLELPGIATGESRPPTLRSSSLAPVAVSGGIAAALASLSLASFLAALTPRAPAALVVAYTRLRHADVLDHPRRAAIVNAVRSSPGLALGEVVDATGFAKGVVAYHAGVLVRAGHLARVESRGFSRYFVTGTDDHLRFAEAAVMLSAGAEARVLDAARREPGLHAAALAKRLGVSRPAVHRVLARLAERGLVERRREGARVRVYARGR